MDIGSQIISEYFDLLRKQSNLRKPHLTLTSSGKSASIDISQDNIEILSEPYNIRALVWRC